MFRARNVAGAGQGGIPPRATSRRASYATGFARVIRFRGDIEGLRAVAVFLVIFNHLQVPGFRGGFVGVDMFFVISGYLITSLLASEYCQEAGSGGHGSISIPRFYARRARRILPVAFAVIAAVVVASRYLLNQFRVAEIHHDAVWAALFGSNINSINQATNYFTQGLATSPLQHYWSLAVEEQFYLVWPAVFLLATKRHGLSMFGSAVRWDRRVAIVIGLVGATSLTLSIYETSTSPAAAYFSTFTRGWELALGASIGIATSRGTALPQRVATAMSMAGLSLMILSCYLINARTPFPGYAALGPTVAAALIILGGIASKQPLPNRGLAIAPLRYLGRISYSLYLWHWPLIVFALALYPVTARSATGRAAILAATLGVSVVSYYIIERPFRRISVDVSRLPELPEFKVPEPIRLYALPVGAAALLSVSAAWFLVPHNQAVAVGYVPPPSARSGRLAPTHTLAQQRGQHQGRSSAGNGQPSGDRLFAQWQSKISHGLSLTKLPADLQPLSDHLQPVPEWIGACEGYRAAIFQHIDECRWGSPAAPRVIAVVGDSHAAMWMTTIKGALNPQTSVVYQFTRNWCGWATSGQHAGPNADCPALQRATIAYLHDLKPSVVILSESGAPDTTSMDEALSAYKRVAAHVVVIGETPILPSWDSCLSGDNGIGSCSGQADLDGVAREEAATVGSGARYIDATSVFCSNLSLYCPPIIDGVPAFVIDGDHLTLQLAQRLVPLMRFEFQETRIT